MMTTSGKGKKKLLGSGTRVFALFIILALLFSFFAELINTNGLRINKSYTSINVRGADLDMEVYKPTDVDSSYKLPCIILAHGGSEDSATTSLVAWEFARRGFVVVCPNSYGAGTSGQPAINDANQTSQTYTRDSSLGYLDVLNYVRSLTYVDQTRLGMWGHSQGYLCESAAMYLDGSYYTMNDRMLNVLHDNFGINISEQQLTQNADTIAASTLDPSQLKSYEYMKTEQKKIYDTRVKAARISASYFAKPVTVAGHKVTRDPQMNLTVGMGEHETPTAYYLGTTPQYKGIFHTGTTNVKQNGWYNIPDWSMDAKATSAELGELYNVNINGSADLKKAVDNRSARMLWNPPTFHTGNLWDKTAISENIEFFTQALAYNNGNLADNTAQPISSKDLTCFYALFFTTLSVIAMIGMLVTLCYLLLKTKYFEACGKPLYTPTMTTKMPIFWISSLLTVFLTYWGTYFATRDNESFQFTNATMTKFLPYEPGQVRLWYMMVFLGLAGLVIFAVLSLIMRKSKTRLASLHDLNIKAGWAAVLKTVVLCVALFGICYLTACLVQSLFGQRLLYLDGSFEVMKPFEFGRLIRYAILLLPFTLMISATSNLTILKNVSDRMDTFISVVVNSLGAYLFLAVGFMVTFARADNGVFNNLQDILSIFTLIPIFSYLYRKLFKLTGSIWTGAIFVSLMLGWRLSGFISHTFMYYGPNLISAFFGIY
jgi:hypothetical protein